MGEALEVYVTAKELRGIRDLVEEWMEEEYHAQYEVQMCLAYDK